MLVQLVQLAKSPQLIRQILFKLHKETLLQIMAIRVSGLKGLEVKPPPPPRDGYCRGRYAPYWNAFLYLYSV